VAGAGSGAVPVDDPLGFGRVLVSAALSMFFFLHFRFSVTHPHSEFAVQSASDKTSQKFFDAFSSHAVKGKIKQIAAPKRVNIVRLL
jgi:hypothetical protein